MSDEQFDLEEAIASHRRHIRRGGWQMVLNLAEFLDIEALRTLTWEQRRDGVAKILRESLWLLDRKDPTGTLARLIENLAQQPTQELADPIWALIVLLADEDGVWLETYKRESAGS